MSSEPAPFGASLEATTEALRVALPPFGFAAEPVRINDTGFRRHWPRDLTWRTDIVEIAYRRGGHLRLIMNLRVQLPDIQDGSGAAVDFAGLGLGTPLIPRWFVASRAPRYGQRVARAVLQQLSWFDRYSTPERCLARMSDPERNGREGKRREQTAAYLKSLCHAVVVGFLSMFAASGCAAVDVEEAHYEHRRAAELDGAIARGRVPDWLPPSARDIREIHNIDTDVTLLRFVFDSADEVKLTRVCVPSEGPRQPLPRENYPTRRAYWWPHELLAGERAIGFHFFRCLERNVFSDGRTEDKDAGLALRERESIAYFWR